jgi:transposase
LVLVFGEKSALPFYYRKLAGNILDVRTVQNLLANFVVLGFDKVKLVMDCGFYIQVNINDLLKEHWEFIFTVLIVGLLESAPKQESCRY